MHTCNLNILCFLVFFLIVLDLISQGRTPITGIQTIGMMGSIGSGSQMRPSGGVPGHLPPRPTQPQLRTQSPSNNQLLANQVSCKLYLTVFFPFCSNMYVRALLSVRSFFRLWYSIFSTEAFFLALVNTHAHEWLTNRATTGDWFLVIPVEKEKPYYWIMRKHIMKELSFYFMIIHTLLRINKSYLYEWYFEVIAWVETKLVLSYVIS